jgi:hypothetical protein
MSNHLTLIRYAENSKKFSIKDSLIDFDSFHEVWTSRPPGRHVQEINGALEFSGYQEGLSRILYEIDVKNTSNKNDHHCIIFANDTIFSGHFNQLAKFMLKCFRLMCKQNSNPGPLLTGLVSHNEAISAPISNSSDYVTSWLFMLEGTSEELSSIKFFDPQMTMENFIEFQYINLPILYRKSIDDWLMPTHFLRGWYQAVPGRELPKRELDRKRFAIYLEHSLPSRVMKSGFKMCDLSERLGPLDRKFLSLLLFMDRCYVNLIKLRFRMLALVDKKLFAK